MICHESHLASPLPWLFDCECHPARSGIPASAFSCWGFSILFFLRFCSSAETPHFPAGICIHWKHARVNSLSIIITYILRSISSKVCFLLGSDSINFLLWWKGVPFFFLFFVSRVILHYILDIMDINYWMHRALLISSNECGFLGYTRYFSLLGVGLQLQTPALLWIQIFYPQLNSRDSLPSNMAHGSQTALCLCFPSYWSLFYPASLSPLLNF